MWNDEDDFKVADSSDEDISDSSDDDADIIFKDLMRQERAKKNESRFPKTVCSLANQNDSDDEFENVMNKKLNDTIKKIEIAPVFSSILSSDVALKSTSADADASDLFYDPDMDDQDDAWVRENLQSYKNFTKNNPSSNSDAVLNCPACMTVLCLDCQRHEKYLTQYRAMFVVNCDVDHSQVLEYSEKIKNRARKKFKGDTVQKYNPVKCSVCKTEVAVYDSDEVYHFFNVLSSFA